MIMNLVMKKMMTKLFQLVRMENVERVLDVVRMENVVVSITGVANQKLIVILMKDVTLTMVLAIRILSLLQSPRLLLKPKIPVTLNHLVTHGNVVRVLDLVQMATVVVNMVGVEKQINTVNLKKDVNPNSVSAIKNKLLHQITMFHPKTIKMMTMVHGDVVKVMDLVEKATVVVNTAGVVRVVIIVASQRDANPNLVIVGRRNKKSYP